MSMSQKSLKMYLGFISFATVLIFSGCASVFGQTESVSQVRTTPPEIAKPKVLQPLLTEYKAVKIGMSADEVRDKLDKKPKLADKEGFYYVFSNGESAQIRLDGNQKVQFISVTYTDLNAAPKYEDVIGETLPITTATDGKIYKLVRFPEAGYWVAYDRTAGDHPTVTVTMQKM